MRHPANLLLASRTWREKRKKNPPLSPDRCYFLDRAARASSPLLSGLSICFNLNTKEEREDQKEVKWFNTGKGGEN